MGSEAPRRVTIHMTGFMKFHGVAQNPTETIVTNLKNYVEKRGLAPSVTLGSCVVLEAAGDGALPMLYKVMESGISGEDNSSNEQVVWEEDDVTNISDDEGDVEADCEGNTCAMEDAEGDLECGDGESEGESSDSEED